MTRPIREQVPLAPRTTLGIGGPARFFTEVGTPEEVSDAVRFARDRALPLLVLGGGSNVLVADEGFSGLVVSVTSDRISFRDLGGGEVRVRAGAGVEWDRLVADCVSRQLAGVECLSGIPGRVGATPVQNVGAYGQEVSDVITSVRAYDLEEGRARQLGPQDCCFDYRSSVFNSSARGRFIVLGVEYRLSRGGAGELSYPDLRRIFGGCRDAPRLSEVREAVLRIRRGKGMLLVAGDSDCRSAGSFFRNPVLSAAEYQRLQEGARGQSVAAPGYPVRGGIKVPAAWLIERAGFPKGSVAGPVGLSTRHALALVNRGGARAADVLRLAAALRDGVEERFGVRLAAEPAFAGFPVDVVEAFGAVAAERPGSGIP